MKNILISLFISCSILSFAQDLWNYANAGADLILFIDSENGEKNMDPELWKQIQWEKKMAVIKDKVREKRAIRKHNAEEEEKEEGDGKSLEFDMKDRHVKLLLNLFVESTTPMVGRLEGAVVLNGNAPTTPLQDFKGLLGDQLANPNVIQSKAKIDGKEAFALDFVQTQNSPPMNCIVIPQDDNTFEFRLRFNGKDGVLKDVVPKNGGSMAMTEGLAGSDTPFAVSCNTQRLASMMNGELTPQMMALKNCLKQTDVGKVNCRISGKDAFLTLSLHFYDAGAAQQIWGQLAPVTETLRSQPIMQQYLRDTKVSVNGDTLIISTTMDVKTGWRLINKFH